MTAPIIPSVYLRPDPVHEVGFDQPQQLDQLGKLLQARGMLALEEEKFQGEQSMQKERLKFEKDTATARQQQLDALKAQLQQAFQGLQGQPQGQQTAPGQPTGQDQGPQALMGALTQAIPALAGAGETAGASAAMRDLPGLQGQVTSNARTQAFADVVSRYAGKTDFRSQHDMLLHLAAIDPAGAEQVNRALTPQEGDFAPIVGADGDIYTLNRRTGAISKTGENGGARGQGLGIVTGAEAAIAARNAIQSLTNALALAKKDPQARIRPVMASALAGAGTTGIGALARGLLGPMAQSQMTPNQQLYQRAIDQFKHNYASLLPKGSRSQAILENLGQSFSLSSGQTDPSVAAGVDADQQRLIRMLMPLAQGKVINMGQLPGFAEAAQDFANPQTPGATPFTGTPNFGDFRSGVPQP